MTNSINSEMSVLTAWIMTTGRLHIYWAEKMGVSRHTMYRWADGSRSIKAEHVQTLIKLSDGKLTLDSLVQIRKDYLAKIEAEKEAKRAKRRKRT